jgi:copper chaperone CopZ
MCQERIEGALKKKDGITRKSWDRESKMMTVSYDPSKISLTQIKQKIAEVGYDTDGVKATDEAYDKLHGCCRYERAK